MSSAINHPGQTAADDSAEQASPLAVLEPALWQRLTEAEETADLAATWLALQCSMLGNAAQAIVRVRDRGGLRAVAAWPEAEREPSYLVETSELAVKEQRPIARGASGGGHPSVAVPVIIGERVEAVVAVGLSLPASAEMKDALKGAIRQLQWGGVWLREHLRQRATTVTGQVADRARTTLDFLASVLEHERFGRAAMAAATELAIRFDCARVSIGFTRRGTTKVAAISHTAHFGRQMNLVRAIGAAMDEAVDQRCSILYPAAADQAVATLAHGALARLQHNGPVLTIPMFVVDGYVGAVTFERGSQDSFNEDEIALLDVIVGTIAPILEEKRRNDRWLIVKAGQSLANQVRRLLGPGYAARKLVAAALVALAAFLSLATDTYRVTADALVEGEVRRAIVSSYDGFIQEATVRAGDTVEEGETLATLEDRELALERLRWETERQQRVFEYDRAMASRQPAAINVTRAQIAQAEAQIELIDEQIARTRLVAPFDGMVVSGDLSQRIGGSVSRGELLFEIAPLTGYRVVMEVDERQIADVAAGQSGEVVFTALPEESFPIVIDKLTPVANSKDGRNLFKVEASLTGSFERLRPGMIGVAKIDIEEQRLAVIWMRPVVEWVRLTAWRWIN